MQFESINFKSCSEVTDLECVPWPPGTTRFVEFFPFYLSKVTLLRSDCPDLMDRLHQIEDGYPVFFDLEWRPDHNSFRNQISVMQFATSKGVIVLQIIPGADTRDLKVYISTHKLIGKGTHNDHQKLNLMFGNSLHIELEDIEVTRLKPRGLSLNFEEMVLSHVGKPSISFKDKKITLSDWSCPVLSTPQILYAAFDVVALKNVASKLPIFKKEQRRKAQLAQQSQEIKVVLAPRHSTDSGPPLKICFKNPK